MVEEQKSTEQTTEDKPLSIVEEAAKIRDEMKQLRDELKQENDRKERLQANEVLGGTTGGNVPAQKVDPEDEKKAAAKEFFKGTALEEAIEKHG